MKKMKQRMKAKASKIVASILVAAMAVAIIPKFTGKGTVLAAGEKNGENTCLGTSGIAAPAVPASAGDAWSGSYVYFGTYGGDAIRFRVLAKDSTAYGTKSLFLDSDKTLIDIRFDNVSNIWDGSEMQDYLNGSFLSSSFTDLERSAVAKSTGSGGCSYKVDSCEEYFYGSPVSINDYVFLLDAAEVTNDAYGYYPDAGFKLNSGTWSEGNYSGFMVHNHEKSGMSSDWWLRSAVNGSSHEVGNVSYLGFLQDNSPVTINYNGVAPALNINQSSILFSSLISGSFNTVGAEYKLTIADDNLTIAVPAGQNVTAEGTTITVPYEISGTDAGTATRASVLILDKAYGTSGAQILYYDALGGTFSNSEAATGTFTLPSSLDIADWGTDYYVYILAEDINGEKETDYASAPVAIDAPVVAVVTTYNVTVTNDGNGTASADVTSGATGTTVTLTASPATGYQFKAWEVTAGSVTLADTTSATTTFDIGTSDATVNATFELIPVTTYTVTFNANGHGTAPAAQTVASGDKATKPSPDPAVSGWTFGGWYTEAACTTAFDFSTAITGDITLYAKWTEENVVPVTYTVTFETNGGSAVAAQTVADGSKATKPADPTKEGFVFDGWYQDATFSALFSFDTPITADITLYAKWTEDTPSTVYYTVVGGGNSSFTAGNASDLVVTVKRSEADETCFSHFTGVQIDGVALVNGTDYTAVAGSTVVTIKKETLNNLSEGGHTINVLFDDGKTETSVTVKAAGTNNNSNTNGNKAIPATGETLAPTLFVGIAFVAVAGMLFAVILVQKRKSVQR